MSKKNDIVTEADLVPKGVDRKTRVDGMTGVVMSVIKREVDSQGKPKYSNGQAKNIINGTGKKIANDLLNFELAKHQRVQDAKALAEPKAPKQLPKASRKKK